MSSFSTISPQAVWATWMWRWATSEEEWGEAQTDMLQRVKVGSDGWAGEVEEEPHFEVCKTEVTAVVMMFAKVEATSVS